jgi:hypothetical protein
MSTQKKNNQKQKEIKDNGNLPKGDYTIGF